MSERNITRLIPRQILFGNPDKTSTQLSFDGISAGEGKYCHGVQFLGFTQEAGLSQYRNYLSQLAVSPPQ